ncbi:MAG TPA: PLP-dependent aminotransferase family protein [Rectinemataceae bacterium]|nr:PLP-dependent aminotransferase family protein [Rectinemataceae bacterium]
MDPIMSAVAGRATKSEIRELLKWTRRSDVISFAGGLPDASLFPIDELVRLSEQVLRTRGYHALQYGPTPGEPDMIEALVQHMRDYDEEADGNRICVTASSQQGLDLVSLLFIDEGSPIIVELPSYIGAIQAFSRSGADMRGVALEEDGIDLEGLGRVLNELDREGRRPRFIYVIPDFQNPSGVTMSVEKRRELIAIARARSIPIVEDSPYREVNFTGATLPSIWTLAGGEGVILLKTFSKMLFPGMRLGWIAAGQPWMDKLIMLKQSVDLCTASFTQFIVADYLREGRMRDTIARAIDCYRPKKDAMLAALGSAMPAGTRWSRPYGGMFLWVELPAGIGAESMFERAAGRGVVYVKGRQFHCDGSGAGTLRLNYSFPSVEQIERGIEILGAATAEELEAHAKAAATTAAPRTAGGPGASRPAATASLGEYPAR